MRERAEIRSSKGLDGPCLAEENSTRGYSSAAVCGDVIKSCIQWVLVELLRYDTDFSVKRSRRDRRMRSQVHHLWYASAQEPSKAEEKL
jgi:hypothetical protein